MTGRAQCFTNAPGVGIRESPEFELLGLTAKEPVLRDCVVATHTARLEKEIGELKSEAEKLAAAIAELTSQAAPG